MSICSVKFKDTGKSYYFKYENFDLKKNLTVVVDTEKGEQFAKVVEPIVEKIKNVDETKMKNVIRISTKKDYNNYLSNDYFRTTTPSMKNSNSSLYTPTEGYNKGNLFADLYEEYKNYKPVTLVAGNEQQKLFLELSKMAFAAHELNLYLDLNPDDETMLSLFNRISP